MAQISPFTLKDVSKKFYNIHNVHKTNEKNSKLSDDIEHRFSTGGGTIPRGALETVEGSMNVFWAVGGQ